MAGLDFTLRVKNAAFKTGLAQSRKQLDGFSKDINRQFSALGGIGLTAGLTLLTKRAIDLGSKLSDLGTASKTDVVALQALDFATRNAGSNSEVLGRALRNVTFRTEEAAAGNKNYTAALERLGLANDEFVSLPTEQKMVSIAKAYTGAENQSRAFADVMVILGEKAGPKLIEVLEKLADEGLDSLVKAAEEAGEVIDRDLIQKLDEASDKIQSFERRATVGAANALGAFQNFGEGLGSLGGMLLDGNPDGPQVTADMFRDQARLSLEREGAFDNLDPRGRRSVSKQRESLIHDRSLDLLIASRKQTLDAEERDRQRRRDEVKAGAEAVRAGEVLPRSKSKAPRKRNSTFSSPTEDEDPFAADPFAKLDTAAKAVRALDQQLRNTGGAGPGDDVDEFRRVGIALSGARGATTIDPEMAKQTGLMERMEQHLAVVAARAEESGLEGAGDYAGFNA